MNDRYDSIIDVLKKTMFIVVLLFFFSLITFAFFKKQELNVTNKPIKVIERHIAGTEKTINNYEKQIGDEKKIISRITSEIEKLRIELLEKKADRDTFSIIPIQDTLIDLLTEENRRLYSVLNLKDSIIIAQRYIINSKDTIIIYQKNLISSTSKDNRKLKWKNRALAGVAILEAGVIIIQSTKK